MLLHRLLSADAHKGMLVTYSNGKDNTFGCKEVFTYSWLCQVGVAWEGSRNQVGSKARKGAEVLEKQGGYQRDTWQRCGLPGIAGLLCAVSFPAETKLLGPLHPSPCSSVGLLSPSWAVTCHVAELQQKCRKKPICLPAQHLKIAVLQRNFSLESFFLNCLNFFPSSGTSFAS